MTKKILLVDDEEAILGLLSEIFSVLGDHSILYSRDGEEALKTAKVAIPDIILLDVQIPKVNGYEVCRLIKSDPSLIHIKIVILSGMVQHFDHRKALEAGADAFITKPFNASALIEKVEELLMI